MDLVDVANLEVDVRAQDVAIVSVIRRLRRAVSGALTGFELQRWTTKNSLVAREGSPRLR